MVLIEVLNNIVVLGFVAQERERERVRVRPLLVVLLVVVRLE